MYNEFINFAGGGTGFIGTALTKLLRETGYDVLFISRTSGKNRITWDDLNETGLPENISVVISLAAQNVFDLKRKWTPELN